MPLTCTGDWFDKCSFECFGKSKRSRTRLRKTKKRIPRLVNTSSTGNLVDPASNNLIKADSDVLRYQLTSRSLLSIHYGLCFDSSTKRTLNQDVTRINKHLPHNMVLEAPLSSRSKRRMANSACILHNVRSVTKVDSYSNPHFGASSMHNLNSDTSKLSFKRLKAYIASSDIIWPMCIKVNEESLIKSNSSTNGEPISFKENVVEISEKKSSSKGNLYTSLVPSLFDKELYCQTWAELLLPFTSSKRLHSNPPDLGSTLFGSKSKHLSNSNIHFQRSKSEARVTDIYGRSYIADIFSSHKIKHGLWVQDRRDNAGISVEKGFQPPLYEKQQTQPRLHRLMRATTVVPAIYSRQMLESNLQKKLESRVILPDSPSSLTEAKNSSETYASNNVSFSASSSLLSSHYSGRHFCIVPLAKVEKKLTHPQSQVISAFNIVGPTVKHIHDKKMSPNEHLVKRMLEPMLSLSLSIGASDPSLHKRHTLESFPDAQIQSQLTSHGGGRIQQSLDTCISSFTKPTSNDPPSNSPLVDGSTLDHPCSFNTSLPDVGVDLDFAPVEREAGRTAGMVSLSTLFDDEDNNDDDVGHNDDRAGDKDRRKIYMPELGACCLARSYLRSRSARVSRQTEWPLGQKAAHEWSFFPVLFVDQPNATALGASGCQINSRRPTRINFSGCRRHPEALYSSVWMLRAVSVGALKLACGEEESNQMCKSRANGDLRSEIYCDMQKRKDCNLTSWGAAMWSGGPHSQLSCYSRQSHLYRPSDNKVKSHEIFATGIRKTRKKASVKSTLPVDSEWSSSWPVNWETTVASLGNGGEGLVVGRKMSLGDTLELKENVFREKTVVKDGKSPSAQYPQHRQEVDNKKQQTDNLRIKQRKSRGLLTQPLEIATRFVRKFLMPKSKKGSAKRSELNISTYVESGSLCPVVISEPLAHFETLSANQSTPSSASSLLPHLHRDRITSLSHQPYAPERCQHMSSQPPNSLDSPTINIESERIHRTTDKLYHADSHGRLSLFTSLLSATNGPPRSGTMRLASESLIDRPPRLASTASHSSGTLAQPSSVSHRPHSYLRALRHPGLAFLQRSTSTATTTTVVAKAPTKSGLIGKSLCSAVDGLNCLETTECKGFGRRIFSGFSGSGRDDSISITERSMFPAAFVFDKVADSCDDLLTSRIAIGEDRGHVLNPLHSPASRLPQVTDSVFSLPAIAPAFWPIDLPIWILQASSSELTVSELAEPSKYLYYDGNNYEKNDSGDNNHKDECNLSDRNILSSHQSIVKHAGRIPNIRHQSIFERELEPSVSLSGFSLSRQQSFESGCKVGSSQTSSARKTRIRHGRQQSAKWRKGTEISGCKVGFDDRRRQLSQLMRRGPTVLRFGQLNWLTNNNQASTFALHVHPPPRLSRVRAPRAPDEEVDEIMAMAGRARSLGQILYLLNEN